MKCPHCLRPVDHEAETCYSCGYSEIRAEELYGKNYVQMARLHDAAHCLRKPDLDEVEEVLDQLEFRFPQMLFCAYLGALNEPMCLTELGFWLLNHAQVRGADYARPNENAILVLLDVNSHQAGISTGYFAETLLTEDEGHRCLQTVRPWLVNGAYGKALATLFQKIGRSLSRRAREIRKMPELIGSESESKLLPTLVGSAGREPERRNPIATAAAGRAYG